MATSRQHFDAEAARRKEREERAARVRAMFERWASEDVADEPEWDVEQIPRIDLHKLDTTTKPQR
jgi:hypothetical protein